MDGLEPDGLTKPPPYGPSRGRLVKKRMKRITRETEARRIGNLAPSSSQREQQNEARDRYQSGTTYSQERRAGLVPSPLGTFRAHPDRTASSEQLTTPDQSASSQFLHPILDRNSIHLDRVSIAQPLESRDQDTLWQRIQAMSARLNETEAAEERYRARIAAQLGDVRRAVNEDRSNDHSHSHTPPMPTTLVEQTTSRSLSAWGLLPSRSNKDQPLSDTDQLLQKSGTSRNDPIASQVTYIDSTVMTNNITFGASTSTPNITISVTASLPERAKRHTASGNEEEDDSEREEPPALSTRSRKRARIDRL